MSPCLLRQACYRGETKKNRGNETGKRKKSLRMRNNGEVGGERRAHLSRFREGIFVPCGRPRFARRIKQGYGANDTISQYHIVILLALLWSSNEDDFVAGWFEFEHGCCF